MKKDDEDVHEQDIDQHEVRYDFRKIYCSWTPQDDERIEKCDRKLLQLSQLQEMFDINPTELQKLCNEHKILKMEIGEDQGKKDYFLLKDVKRHLKALTKSETK